MNRFHYKILSVFIITLSLFTFPTNAKEYSSEIGTLWNFTVSKQINRINLQIQQNVWTLGKYYERYMPIAVVSYTAVPKYLRLNALYYYMNQQTAPNIYKNRHRYQLGARTVCAARCASSRGRMTRRSCSASGRFISTAHPREPLFPILYTDSPYR